MTEAERRELEILERKLANHQLALHQARLMCSSLRREIRLSIPHPNNPEKYPGKPFHRIARITVLSDALIRQVKDLRDAS